MRTRAERKTSVRRRRKDWQRKAMRVEMLQSRRRRRGRGDGFGEKEVGKRGRGGKLTSATFHPSPSV